MRSFWRKNDGLTLVELIVSMAIGTMIFAAATTVLLLGIRVHNHTTGSVMQQYTARAVITVLEDMASEGAISEASRKNNGSWFVKDSEKRILLSYDGVEQAIYTGTFVIDEKNPEKGTVILDNIVASYVVLEGNVLTFSLETEDGPYTASVYCRSVRVNGDESFTNEEIELPNEIIARQPFLEILDTQAGGFGGIINHDTHPGCTSKIAECGGYTFFSQWYTNNYKSGVFPGWSTETPWCACFVSWGLCHVPGLDPQGKHGRWFGNVDDFMDYFPKNTGADCWKLPGSIPQVGDLVFFNMIDDDKGNPSHMGVVLELVEDATGDIVGIRTIEGNSADLVAKRTYQLDDSRIIGYGDPWAAQAKPNDNT